jgi:tetratricopeptide (TPR) repeat protein
MSKLPALLLILCLVTPAAASQKASYRHYLKAMLLANQGSFSEALREYEAALELDPESAFMYEQAAELALEIGRTDRAVELSQRFAALAPNDPQAHFLLGNVHWARGEFEEARAAFEKTLEIRPDFQEALFTLGNLLSAQSPAAAVEYLERYLKKNPDNASDAEYQIAVIAQRAGRLKDSISHLRSSIELDPDNMQARHSLAQIYEVERDTTAALAVYLEILDRDSRNVALLNHIGEMFYMKDDLVGAKEHFERAKSLQPSNPTVCLWLALLAEQENDFAAAVGHVKESAALPQDAALNLRLSYYLTQASDLPEAVAVLERAHERWPRNEELSYFLALGYDDLKAPRKAVKLMTQVLEIRPEHRDARFQLGAIYEKIGDIKNAEKQFREIISRHPNDASALNFLGYSLADRGLKLDDAEKLIRRAVDLHPQNGAYLDSLGWVYFKQGRMEQALTTLREAAGLLPTDDAVWEHLGATYRASGDKSAAWDSFKRAQVLAPSKKSHVVNLEGLEKSFSAEKLGRRFQEFLAVTRGDIASYGGPCVIDGKVGKQNFRFTGILHYRAPWDLTVDVLGPLFVPLFRAAVHSGDDFSMDPLNIDGVSQEFLRDHMHSALKLLRDYFEGAAFRADAPRYRKAWGRRQIVTPQGTLELNKDRTRLATLKAPGKSGFRLKMDDYRLVGGRWVPAKLRLEGRGFMVEFSLESPAVGFN